MSEGRMVHGVELVDATARPGTMNMYLHGIGQATGEPVIAVRDTLATKAEPVSMVLANLPFGRKSVGDGRRGGRPR